MIQHNQKKRSYWQHAQPNAMAREAVCVEMISPMRHPLAVSFLLILFVAGCGAPTGNVTGRVSFEGQKLKSGMVRFVNSDGEHKYVRGIKSDGTYKIENLSTGTWKVAVLISPLPGPAFKKNDPPLPKFAEKFGDPDQSKLTCVIKANETTTYNIELTR